MSEWKTIKHKTIETYGNNFVEVSLKKAPEGENTFIGISKGWKTDEGIKRYKANILFTKEKKDEIIKALAEILDGVEDIETESVVEEKKEEVTEEKSAE